MFSLNENDNLDSYLEFHAGAGGIEIKIGLQC